MAFLKKYGLIFALAFMAIIILMPTPEGLSVGGQRVLGILVFAVTVWITEAISYPASAAAIISFLALFLGTSPNPATGLPYGTGAALGMALKGFSTGTLILVGSALFIAVAMMKTGLDKRIALVILSKIGAKTNRALIGIIMCGFILSFFVPSTTARVSCLVPIVMGILATFKLSLKGPFAAMMMIAVAQADSIWNIGIKTAAGQNLIAVGFIEKTFGQTITWLDWLIAAAPYAAIMSVVLYFLLMKLMPPEVKEIEGGKAAIKEAVKELGPMTWGEKKLMIISVVLLAFWSTEKILHNFDTSTTALVAVAVMLIPRIGILDWKDAQSRIAWGTLCLFGASIGLGGILLSQHVASWLATCFLALFNVQAMPAVGILAVLGAFLIMVHLGFASAAALASTMIPIIISIVQEVQIPGFNAVGMVMVCQFMVSFGMILPVNAPQNMVSYSTGCFEVKDFMKVGIPLTIIGYLIILLLGATYWNWLGIIG